MKKQLLLGLALTTLSVGLSTQTTSVLAQPVSEHEINQLSNAQQSDSRGLIAFTIPNFEPQVSVADGVLAVNMPVSFFEGPINEILRANQGNYKNTEFQRLDVSSMRVAFTNGGFNVNGNWRFQFRERIGRNPITKKIYYSPWASISGSFVQPFSVQVANDRLVARAGKPEIRSAGKWYQPIVDALIPRFVNNAAISQSINRQLASFNGMDIRQLMINTGAAKVSQALGINDGDARNLINSRIGTMNAGISGGQLKLSVRVK